MQTQEKPWNGTHAELYTALRELLLGWRPLWSRTVFERFAEMERLVPEPWFRFGATANLADQFAVAQGESHDAPESLVNLIQSIQRLCALPRNTESQALSPSIVDGLTPKKRHEVEALLGFLRKPGTSVSTVLDIGGGAGHLARHLAHGLGCPVESIDRDPVVQKKGLRILTAHPWRDLLKHSVRFVSAEFTGAGSSRRAGAGSWAVGLHTCGKMAWSHLELVSQGYSVLNIGCCYEKLDVVAGTERSRLARQMPLGLTNEALFLANRSGVKSSLEEFVFQQRVLRYRYSLYELLLREGYSDAQCAAVGSARSAAYSGSFSGYVRDRSRIGLSDAALEDFYRSIEALIERRRFVSFIRHRFARPLEIALLLDRALFIEEEADVKPAQARLIELFDPAISPRNVGLIVLPLRATV